MNRTAWILSGLFVVLVVVLIFVLGDDGGDETTTTLGATTTSLEGVTTTAGETTSTEATTTTLGVTTTTLAVTTTTAAGVEGNWADQPVVVAGFGALGWWDGDSWAQVDAGTALPVDGDEDYQVAVLGLEAITSGSAPTTLCEPLNNPGVILDNEEILGDFPGPYGVAVTAPWILVPHLVEEVDDDGTHSAFAAELLAEAGLEVADPVIKQLIRTDLEGDGVNEVIVVSEDVTESLFAEVGDYSIIFLRKTVGGSVQTTVLGESVVTSPDQAPLVYSFSAGAVADLSGDGKMEIVVSAAYYEGLGVEVWEYVSDEQGPVRQISQGCGA